MNGDELKASNRKQFGLYERQGTRLEPMACKGSGVRISLPPLFEIPDQQFSADALQ